MRKMTMALAFVATALTATSALAAQRGDEELGVVTPTVIVSNHYVPAKRHAEHQRAIDEASRHVTAAATYVDVGPHRFVAMKRNPRPEFEQTNLV